MEAGQQWPFSCFSPLKDEHLIPGMDDLSPEELRLEAYEAQNKNNLDGYAGSLFGSQPTTTPTSTFSFSTLANSGPQPSQSIFGGGTSFSQASSTFAQPAPFATKAPVSSIFGQAPASSVFGQTSAAAPPPAYGAPPAYGQASSLFGQATSTTNVFGQQSQPSTNVFSQVQPTAGTFTQPQSNLFGQASQQTSTANVFGQTQPASTVFGQAVSTTGNVFGQPAATTSVFGAGTSQSFQSQTPLFGQNQFAAQPQTFTEQTPQKSVFAPQSVPTTPPSNVFSQATPTNAFTTPPSNVFTQQSNTFNTPAQNVFTSQAQPQNAFSSAASTTPQTNAFSQPSNPFTQTAFAQQQQSEKSNPFTQAAVSQNHYSKLEDLTEEEIAAFKADEFVLGKIPTKPPPLEMA
ncbi:hypothetical protein B566_EDAN004537 [Ephemera danica]|nr:hypothetical protein B566_EDAN004537 [Ephemera danica]